MIIQNKKIQYLRLNHFLSISGIASRRNADKLIKSGIVKINGKLVNKLGTYIHINDIVTVYGTRVKSQKKIYILINKPKGCITSTHDPLHRKTIMNLVTTQKIENQKIYPIGRLDYFTTGVLLLTNDGYITNIFTHPKYNIQKIYHVVLNKMITNEDINKIKNGKIYLKEGKVIIDYIKYLKYKNQLKIKMHIGWNKIIKRLFKKLHYKVIKLDRINFGGFTKNKLKRGKYKFLSQEKVYNMLKQHLYHL
ncbi:pseudouridine synthase [Blattabacterium cuenoti]|uniref:pseudouridine synthase n=1 Tax=Blattabacterium cuenoti TaxID=1653831 RepID=UPI00163BDB37|nr:pseudouridine synthase [Blattabacterium cuenoti]